MSANDNRAELFGLEGKVCVVTGAGGEIGQGIAAALAEHGARVALTDINAAAVEAVADGLTKAGGTVMALPHDVTSPSSWQEVFAAVTSAWGALGVLANVAGVIPAKSADLATLSLEEWRRFHAVNLDGAFLGVQAAVNGMAPGGSIINIGSIVGYFGARSGIAYGTSKAAIRGLSMQAAAAVVADGLDLRINTLHPGYILTDAALGEQVEELGSREAAEEAFASRNPRNRCLTPDALVGPLLFLASDASRYMNGAELVVDDGMSVQMPGRAFA
ncbi:SDR family NAD(P)-dependent oxidoreductase [Pseudoroseicyclus sp. H15]